MSGYGFKHQLGLWRQFVQDYWAWLREYRNCSLQGKTFELDSRTYNYFVHPYNHTWGNERAVEIPVIREVLARTRDDAVLEVGNVLSHYFRARHPVLDKYERNFTRRVINQDIVSHLPTRKYDLIVSISTLEHIGWDEQPRDTSKLLAAFSRLRQMLAPAGRVVATVPFGYNDFLDQSLRDRSLDLSRVSCLKRVSAENEWEETDLETAASCSYGTPFAAANAIAILVLENDERGGGPSNSAQRREPS